MGIHRVGSNLPLRNFLNASIRFDQLRLSRPKNMLKVTGASLVTSALPTLLHSGITGSDPSISLLAMATVTLGLTFSALKWFRSSARLNKIASALELDILNLETNNTKDPDLSQDMQVFGQSVRMGSKRTIANKLNFSGINNVNAFFNAIRGRWPSVFTSQPAAQAQPAAAPMPQAPVAAAQDVNQAAEAAPVREIQSFEKSMGLDHTPPSEDMPPAESSLEVKKAAYEAMLKTGVPEAKARMISGYNPDEVEPDAPEQAPIAEPVAASQAEPEAPLIEEYEVSGALAPAEEFDQLKRAALSRELIPNEVLRMIELWEELGMPGREAPPSTKVCSLRVSPSRIMVLTTDAEIEDNKDKYRRLASAGQEPAVESFDLGEEPGDLPVLPPVDQRLAAAADGQAPLIDEFEVPGAGESLAAGAVGADTLLEEPADAAVIGAADKAPDINDGLSQTEPGADLIDPSKLEAESQIVRRFAELVKNEAYLLGVIRTQKASIGFLEGQIREAEEAIARLQQEETALRVERRKRGDEMAERHNQEQSDFDLMVEAEKAKRFAAKEKEITQLEAIIRNPQKSIDEKAQARRDKIKIEPLVLAAKARFEEEFVGPKNEEMIQRQNAEIKALADEYEGRNGKRGKIVVVQDTISAKRKAIIGHRDNIEKSQLSIETAASSLGYVREEKGKLMELSKLVLEHKAMRIADQRIADIEGLRSAHAQLSRLAPMDPVEDILARTQAGSRSIVRPRRIEEFKSGEKCLFPFEDLDACRRVIAKLLGRAPIKHRTIEYTDEQGVPYTACIEESSLEMVQRYIRDNTILLKKIALNKDSRYDRKLQLAVKTILLLERADTGQGIPPTIERNASDSVIGIFDMTVDEALGPKIVLTPEEKTDLETLLDNLGKPGK